MATKSFLTAVEMKEALQVRLRAPTRPPDGDERRGFDQGPREFSHWLQERLLAKLSQHPNWQLSGPIALGSWSKGELCPKSDIDLLFTGPEDKVKALVQDFASEGLKLRYRMPANFEDWTEGVLPFDVLALLAGRPLNDEAGEKLHKQLELLRKRDKKFRLELLRAMKRERQERAERYDSISNFLEPNLKYGPGGLRDLEQALVTRSLFPERFEGAKTDDRQDLQFQHDHAFVVLLYYKSFFLLIRQRLHLSEGASDVLSAPEQRVIAHWMGFRDDKVFMREVQKGLSRVSFYADWVVARASRPAAQLRAVDERPLKNPGALFQALWEDPSILMQNRVRTAADAILAGDSSKGAKGKSRGRTKTDRVMGRELSRFLKPDGPEPQMVALFRSRLIDHAVPEIRKIVGYVQHDQYHRFAVDAHLLQVLRELKRLRARPQLAGRLSEVLRRLSKVEWDLLAFASLYHDLAKGRGGDHAAKGVELAKVDLARFGKSKAFVREVCWLVEEHLGLSAAAFRENPRSPRVWRSLAERGVKGRRILLLAVFTIVDIRGTNPEAWTSWKERLLFELVQQLERPEADSAVAFAKALREKKLKGWEAYVDHLDPFLIGAIPAKALAEDISTLQKAKSVPNPKLLTLRRGGQQSWLRFHDPVDRPGLFLNYVQCLARYGLAIRHASIHTDPQLGVYDWFEIKTTKKAAALKRILKNIGEDLGRDLSAAAKGEGPSSGETSMKPSKKLQVRFDAIEIVSEDQTEWVISFRGRDQSGALSEAARVLSSFGAEIHWAKVHTWGRQIDDVFGIRAMTMKSESFLESLRADLTKSPLHAAAD